MWQRKGYSSTYREISGCAGVPMSPMWGRDGAGTREAGPHGHCLVPVVPRPAHHQHPTSPPPTLSSRLLPSAPVCSAEYCRVVACVVTKYSAQFGPLQPAAGQTGAPRDWSQHLQASFYFNLVFHNLPVYFFIVSYYTYRTNGSKNCSRGATLFSCAIFHM